MGRYLPSPIRSLVLISLLLGVSSWANRLVPRDDVQELGISAPAYLHERLPLWQQRLHLDQWQISILFCRATELKPRTLGNIHWDAAKQTAVIRVLDAADYRLSHEDMLQDMEFTVVHELIHLDLASLPKSEASRRDEEFAVNRVAEALLDIDRQPRRKAAD